jgi:hypothetical protein
VIAALVNDLNSFIAAAALDRTVIGQPVADVPPDANLNDVGVE